MGRSEINLKTNCRWFNDDDETDKVGTPDRNDSREFNINSDVYLAQLDRHQAVIKRRNHGKRNL